MGRGERRDQRHVRFRLQPRQRCTRAQIVTILYRAYQGK